MGGRRVRRFESDTDEEGRAEQREYREMAVCHESTSRSRFDLAHSF
jgi:hypothetical protein